MTSITEWLSQQKEIIRKGLTKPFVDDYDWRYVNKIEKEHERALLIIEKYREALDKLEIKVNWNSDDFLPNQYKETLLIIQETRNYFPEVDHDSK